MIYTEKIKKAVNFSIKVHEIDRHQKRKGKEVSYITHPLTVGLILSQAGAGEDLVIAGILHDTIEDSSFFHKVTKKDISGMFGENVAELVMSVTEKNKLSFWDTRKHKAYEEIKNYSHDSILLKSSDVVANVSELVSDYEREGYKTFKRFKSAGSKILTHYVSVIDLLIEMWPSNPLIKDLMDLKSETAKIVQDIECHQINSD